MVVLFLTFSRGGLVAFMLVLGFLFIRLNYRFIGWLVKKWQVKKKVLVSVLAYLGMIILYLALAWQGYLH